MCFDTQSFLYRCILDTVILPVPSYGLKQIEKFVGFERSQEEYGGSWSLVKYNQYLQAIDAETSNKILDEIKTYNAEDLLATYAVYNWLEENICQVRFQDIIYPVGEVEKRYDSSKD